MLNPVVTTGSILFFNFYEKISIIFIKIDIGQFAEY